ncbi:large subunit ribosomal protein L17 [Catalinimonas alkaloidigena]|uniref:50S ribosomal protein L17 n=1 Tax=Catalinimonas alkaloidigena TaxID=1075417 RepID=UPI0024070492|nr:50S ribosomal protein L17 [Catalinimonas alkaloidigena]MDF9795572.1 large subunit ribosomal protein L17 [Catalinimonas alkaloidigena]
MRHAKKFNHLGRTAPHRKAMLANMASSLILHKRITTTVAKAKALRKYVEPLITRSKADTTHSRRVVFSYLQDKTSAQVLFNEVAERVAERPGGYTRIIKLGNRLGDNADMCLIELVDFNETYMQEDTTKKKSTRRSRRSGKKSSSKSEAKSSTAEATEVEDKKESQPTTAGDTVTDEAETTEVEEKKEASTTDEKVEGKADDQSKEADDSSDSEDKENK